MQLKVTAKGCRVVINTFLLWSVQWNCCYREIDKVTIHLQVITFLLCFNAFLSLNHISQRRAHTVYELSKFIVTHSRKIFITVCMTVNIFASPPTAKQQIQHRTKSMSCSCLTAAALMRL